VVIDMNYIEISPLFKEKNNVQTTSGIKIQVNIDTITHITPELLQQLDSNMNLDELYGLKANITCNSKARIVISDFNYFALDSFENADTVLGHIKVNNIRHLLRLNKVKVDRIDIENSSLLLIDCNIREVYLGIEDHFKHRKSKENEKTPNYSIDIRNCKISKLTTYVDTTNINIQDSVLDRLAIQSDSDNLSIGEYSEITDLVLSQSIKSLKLDNSSINFMQGTSSLLINEFNNNYSNVANVYNIFESNLISKNEESYDLIRTSYRVRNDYDKYAYYSYLINMIYLKKEDHIATKIPLMLLNISCGFGYKLANTIKFSTGVIVLFSIFYFWLTYHGREAVGLNIPGEYTSLSDKALYSLYHSIITFATLGYGDTIGQDWITKFLSAAESLLGIYSMSVIVYTLTKKYSSFK
jgi:hypothetical protein